MTLYYTPAANAGGVATVTVSLTDDATAGGPAITTPAQTFTITVNRPPVAMEQSVTTTRNTPHAVTLDAWDMDGDALTYTVVSGPAHGSLSGIAPNLTYTPALGYTGPDSFSFTANDGQATSAPATVTITVNAPPVANAGADQTGNIGQVLTFSAAASYDPDGTIANNYIWIWGDNTAGSFSTVTATHSYANPGTYTVTLTVFDNDGATATDSLTVTVNAPPVAPPTRDRPGRHRPVRSAFSGAASTDSDGSMRRATPGTGATAPPHGSGSAPPTPTRHRRTPRPSRSRSPTNNGTIADRHVLIRSRVNDPPIANAGADQTGNVGQILSFSGAASTDPDGTIASYSWNWGDGTAAGSGVSATHAYATAGSKTVTLTVTDNSGATATDTLIVTVNAGEPGLEQDRHGLHLPLGLPPPPRPWTAAPPPPG